ncbi:MAG: hypothetical protein GY842_24290 [bacterium]|nr:hypothetical protein [bacterium]
MKIRRIVAQSAIAMAVIPSTGLGAPGSVLFSSDMDSGAAWMVNGTADTAIEFGWDFTSMGIPASPGGSVTGLRLAANIVSPTGAETVVATPTDFTVGGLYTVEFDFWVNANGPFPPGGGGATEFIGGGVGYDGGTPDRNGALLLVDGEGGSSRDWQMYKDTAEQFVAGGQYHIDTNNNSGADLSAFFPPQMPPVFQQGAYPQQSGQTAAGCGAFAWHNMLITVDSDAGTANFKVDGLSIGTLDANLGSWVAMSGAVEVMYTDLFSSVSDNADLSFGLIDNFVVKEGAASVIGACCLAADACTEDTEDSCLAWGGTFRGEGTRCPVQGVARVVEPGGWVFVHIIDPSVNCFTATGRSAGCTPPGPGEPFIDSWVSPEDEAMCHLFGTNGSPAIPADFFDPGSDPFTGVVCLRGTPLGSTPFGDFGDADTLIRRQDDPFDRCALPSLVEQTVDIEIAALSLEGVDPITVTFNGGQDPELWDVPTVGLSEVHTDVNTNNDPPMGSLTVTKTHCNGGTYTSVLHVQPRFTFTKVGAPGEVRVLDTGLEGIDPVLLEQTDPASWVGDLDPMLGLENPVCSDFHAGIVGAGVQTECDCNTNGVRDACDTPDGDIDGDGQTDLADLAIMVDCVTGLCTDPPCFQPLYGDPCCVLADFDRDGDIDLGDYQAFQESFDGP